MVAIMRSPTRGPGAVRLCKRAPVDKPHWKRWGEPCETCARGEDIAGIFAERSTPPLGYVSPHELKIHRERNADLLRGNGPGVIGPFWRDPIARVTGHVASWEHRDNPRRPRSRWRGRAPEIEGREDVVAVSTLIRTGLVPPREREVFRLFYRVHLSYQECAKMLGVAPKTFRGLLGRLRRRARGKTAPA